MSKIKSFRGRIADGGTDLVSLHTNTGSTGYRIKKFELMPSDPANDNIEIIVQIWKTSLAASDAQSGAAADWRIDFSDNKLLATGYIEDNAGDTDAFHKDMVIFDNEVFNQDIYITSIAPNASADGVNYYLELEQVKLDLNENTVATLKDVRNTRLQQY